ncbi:hypothetical protein [Nonomuraea lactucae]|uniref:hypothetical protein n=1 Tax=Nonomuraea lactucae TaxID=2249762 RepID=UPI000DE3671E|nr:hypothetical protein [Nonomuraea lactucae]
MEYIIVAAAAVSLMLLVRACFDTETAWRVFPVLAMAFLTRLVIHVLFLRSGSLGYGGDNLGYELTAMEIVDFWKSEGFQLVSTEEVNSLYSASVPCHVFALVIYACGGFAPLACTSLVALLACALCIVMYKFARLIGAEERPAFRLLVLVAFIPAFLVHTSDMFKDGFNAFLVVACLGLAASNVQRFDIRKVLLLAPLLWALWHVRPYMVFMCAIPLLLGIVNPRHVLSLRLVAISVAALVCAAVFVEDITASSPALMVTEELEHGQAENVRRSNASDDSGIEFDDGGNAWSNLAPKLLYTLLSPFPWMGGSMALQFGKLEALLLYYLLYCAGRGVRRLWHSDRRMLLLLLLFIVPGTIAYATTVANIGLIFRQRIPIVLIISLLSAVSWNRLPEGRPPADSPGKTSVPV